MMNSEDQHNKWMREAFREAGKAYKEGEVPVGAVVVLHSRIIGRGHNRVEALQDATAHAEILALTAAFNTLSSWRLDDAVLYVTLEPCVMCAGAIMNARINRIVFGTFDSRAGACGSRFNLPEDPRSLFNVDITSGIMALQCSKILRSFFQLKRQQQN